MRAWLVAVAALAVALAPRPPRASAASPTARATLRQDTRLEHIKTQILAKLGLSTRPTPHGAPPRDVVRQILARAAGPEPDPPAPREEQSMREIIAIAHRAKCSTGCTGSQSGQSFLNGQKYNYAVDGTVTIFLTGAAQQETSLKLLGQASVSALGNCAYVLKIQDMAITGPDGRKYGKPPGLEKPVRFTLENGKAGPELCSEDGDTRRSLNIKRAIISLLQTEQKSSTETDFFGICPTEISSSQEGAALLLHKRRDLSLCGHREQGKNGLMNAVFNPTAEIKETSVLRSTLNVESKVNGGVPEKISANEEYLYRPFSVGENGARAKVHTKLTLTGKTGGALNGHFTETHTIIFENPHGTDDHQSSAQFALMSVRDTAKALQNVASEKSAGLFAELIRTLRFTKKQDLFNVYSQVKGNTLERRVFLDALFRAGTGHSLEIIIEILKKNEFQDLEQPLAYLSLGNARHVDDDALKAAATLLDMQSTPKELFLGVGALAGAYCRDHYCHDGKASGVVAVSQKFAAKLPNCRTKDKLEEDRVIAILKGVRNIRHLENNLIDKLAQCANDNNAKARVRVAALEAFQADPCNNKLKSTGLDLMKNRQLDSEIRIKAYLSVISCPCAKSATEIKNLLDTEPVQQVGRFITTSLRHIRTSANPDKALARQHYGLIHTPNRFKVDDRKYSFYREASYNIDTLGLGGTLEQTVIYSQDSFLPRSASFNLTAEIFGHSLNVLEMGGRQGNLDRVAEHFFGPKGLLRTEDPQSLYDNIMRRYEETMNKLHNFRRKRSVQTEVDSFDRRVKAEATPYNNELDLDIYIKLFGTDALFLSLGDDKGFDFNRALDHFMQVLGRGMDEVKHFQHEIRTHLLFLDAELAYPTSTGLPLKLDLVGSATARFELATNIDVRQILNNPNNAKIDIKLMPSTDIEIAGIFLVDADIVSTGLKVTTNLHSSTGGHLVAKVLEQGRGIDLQLALPLEKQEIVTASSDLVYVTRVKGQKEKQTALRINTPSKEYSGCFDQLANVVGLTLCAEVSLPFSFSRSESQAYRDVSNFVTRFPLTGPAKLKLVLEKQDLRGYHIKGIVRNDEHKGSFELLFEAEGSRTIRTLLTGELVNEPAEKTVKLAIESPFLVSSGQISLYAKHNEYAALVQLKNGSTELYGKLGFNVQGNERRSVYKPVLEFKYPGRDDVQRIDIDGQLVVEKNGPETKYTFGGKFQLPQNEDMLEVNGHAKCNPSSVELDMNAKMRNQELLTLSASKKDHDYKIAFTNSFNPNVNFKLDGHFENGPETNHNDFEISYGDNFNNQHNRIIYNQLLKYHNEHPEQFSFITKNKFEIRALPFKLEFDADFDPKKLDVKLEGIYTDRKVEFDLESRRQIRHPGDYRVKFEVKLDKKGVEALFKRDIVSQEKTNYENTVEIKNIGKYELSGVVTNKQKPNDNNVGFIGHFKVQSFGSNGRTEDFRFDIGLVDNGHYYSTHAKVGATRGDILDYLFKVTYGGSPTGQLKFTLKDTIEANGQFTITSDSQGRGTGLLIVDFKKSQRKFKVDLKCQVNDPIFNADVDLFLNYEKDNNDKLHFSTQTKSTDHLFESKNVVEYAGKKGELNLHKDGTLALGKTHASAELVLPTERCFTLNMDRDMNVHDDVYNGNYNMLFSDAAKRGAAASTIGYKFKLTNTNFDKEELDYEGQFEMKLNNGRNLQNTFFLKNVPNGPMSKFDFKSDVTGNLIPQPASFSANCEYTNALEIDGSGNYKFKGNYGREYSFEYNGVSDVKIVGEGGKKYQDDNELTLRLPFEDAHDIKLTSNMLYVQADSENINYEYNLVEGVQINGEVYKLEANGKSDNGNGNSKIKVAVPRVDPVSLDITYAFSLQGDRKTGNVEIKSIYGKNTSPLVTAAEITTAPQEVAANLKLITPRAIQNIGQKFVLNAHFKNPAPNIYLLPAMLAIDDKQAFVTDSQISLSTTQPLLDISYQAQPSQRPSKVYFKGELQNTSNRKLDFKLENVNGISLNTAMEANEERDNLNMKFNGDSEKLGMKNFKMELSSKDAGNGKRLEIHVTNDNQNILSGSTSYITKEEGPKTIIEGSGSVRVREEQKSVNFKYIRTLLTEGNEQGIETFFNMAVGERSYVTEYRSTNLEYKYSYVYCEEKKQCAHAEINSKVNLQGPGVAQHVLNVGFDLRKLGISPEFGLQVSNEVSDHRLPQYSLDLHVNNQDKKYHMHVYSQPEFGKFPSGITITLPQRVLALEGLVTYPKDKSMPFPVQGELVLHLDKNKPQMKTAGRFLLDVQETNDVYAILAEAGFSHPRLGREAVARYRQVLERKEANTYKIESAGTISFPPFGSDLNTKLTLEASPTKLKLLVETPVIRIISLESSATLRDNLQQGEVTFSLLQGKPVHILALARDYTYYEFTTGYTDEQERKLSIIGHLQPESRVDISADIFLPGQKKNIAHGAVFLQENTVKSEYGVSKDNFNYFLNALKSDVDNLEARIKQAGEKASNDFKNSLKRAEPTFKQMQQSYEEELTKLYREIENDQTLKEFSKTISDVYSYLAAIIVDIIEHTKPLVDTVIDIVTETSKAIQKMFEERLEPQIKELYNTIAAGVKETLNGLLDLVASFTALFTDFFERHRAELEELTNTIGDIFIDLTRLVVAQLKEFYTSLLQTLTDLQVQIQNLPIFNIIQEKWKDLAVPDQVVALLQEAQNTARNLMPNDETRAFSDALFNYIQKKLRQERMDEGAELRNLWEKFTEAQVSLIQFARLHFSQLGVLYPFDWSSIPFWFSPSGSLPSLGNAPRFSILEQIMKGEFPEAFEVIKAYRPRSLNPFDEVPSKLRAVIVNGQHIFTFDGRHMTFPGNCRYVLAHDFADRNFTLVMQLQNGQPKSLILEDKSGTTVELKDNKQAALNGAVHPFPIIEKDTFAFKTANERVGLGSLYGVMAFCSQQLEVCYIEVSGYYSGKLRGLLGDGNNEAYDDLRMPNGRVVTSESEFGNAYRLVTSCPQVRTPEHSVHQHHSTLPAACEQVFGGNSPLRPLSLLLDIAPFRQACIHAVSASSADALKEACDLGRGYAALALTGLLPAVLPRACLRCTDTDTPKEIGDTYTYTLPARQADIVVTFETTKQSEDAYRKLLVPLVGQLVSGLKSKHVDDIRVYLVGITPKYPYPIVYDTDLRIGNAKVQFDDESRYTNIPRVYERNADVTFRQYQDRFYNLIDNILIKLGLTNVVASYESTLQLPLRPGAVKHSINLVGEQCRDQFFLLEALRNFAYEIMFSHNGYKHTLIAPTPNLQIGNGKVPAQVVGFSEKAVIMLGDRRVGKDAEALRPTLEVQSDSCIDFVENTDGLTLSSTNFEALNAAQQKQYLQTASHAILHELLDYNLTQECVCAYADPLRAQSICVTKERREITRRRK